MASHHTYMPFLDANMQAQEELAALLSRNLTLNPVPAQQPFQQTQQAQEGESKITYSISQHYHHSAHVAKQQLQSLDMPPSQQRAASEPPQPEYQVAESVLINHGVDPSVLSRAQLELFKTVDDPEKVHLIQLWRFSPPTGRNDNPTLAWSSTSIEQEEALVKMRRQHEELANSTMSLDGTPVATPMQGGDSRWHPQSYMEPYMSAGYEGTERAMEYNHSTDPVFRTTNSGVSWSGTNQRQQQEMEDNYGLLMAMRDSEMEL